MEKNCLNCGKLCEIEFCSKKCEGEWAKHLGKAQKSDTLYDFKEKWTDNPQPRDSKYVFPPL